MCSAPGSTDRNIPGAVTGRCRSGTGDTPITSPLNVLSRNWWLFLVRGLIAIPFGIIALVWPELTLSTLILLFGFYTIFDGVVAI